MLLISICCVAVLAALGVVMGPLMLLDDHLERRRARLERAALGHLDDPVTIPAPRAELESPAATTTR